MDIFTAETKKRIADHAVNLHLVPKKKDYDELLDSIGGAKVVLIGEASHGTHEFYRERALITKRLIEEKDFTCVAVEGDFPDVFRVNQYVQRLDKHGSPGKNATEALDDFQRFPLWMWRNHVVVHFVEWLRQHNERVGKEKRDAEKTVITGLDVYSLHRSAEKVIAYLEKVDKKAAKMARNQYACFERFGDDTMTYAFSARYGLAKTCEDEAHKVVESLQLHVQDYLRKMKDGLEMESDLFSCVMNAYAVEGAEKYYRVMLDADATSWNVRDSYMVKTLERLVKWKSAQLNRQAKVVVWAHNSHLGDASFTEMGRRRHEHNVGELCRRHFGAANVFNIGFTTYHGKVTCSSDWGQAKIEMKSVNPGIANSYERFFHEVSEDLKHPNFMVIFKKITKTTEGKDGTNEKTPTAVGALPELPEGKTWKDIPLSSFPLERAIGVIYRPETERLSHYFETLLSEQFDAVIHVDKTSALLGLDDDARKPGEEEENLPELFPFGV
ncbi:hypothetical protein BV898_04658 [Hypsibius exemplaris]|uniref:Erythromycin esterase n=1 Tax=Hypsibius exemplaris TaxID=2072580 RepID=A0A1W0X1W1_HYPEX|nr:hypothetical protein BV898_04658 [Hypsibius exemplaris]